MKKYFVSEIVTKMVVIDTKDIKSFMSIVINPHHLKPYQWWKYSVLLHNESGEIYKNTWQIAILSNKMHKNWELVSFVNKSGNKFR